MSCISSSWNRPGSLRRNMGIRRVRTLAINSGSRPESRDVWSISKGCAVEDFYKNVLDFVKEVNAGKGEETKARAHEAQQRIISGSTIDRAELVSELSVLFNYVGCMLYRRGYRDAEHHHRAINPVHRTPKVHEEFNSAVTKMLDKNTEMQIEDICRELERRKVSGAFDIDGRSEDFGPNGVTWTEKPIPRSVKMAIKRIRTDVRRRSRASQRQLLLALPKRKS
jgi:hypothetical protein